MNKDNRLSDVLHILLHLEHKKKHQEGPLTSLALAKSMRTNPVVIRRIMAGLRDQGYVRSEKGHGGGWTLACDLSKVTMHDIYLALQKPTLFAIGNRSDAPDCLVEKAVNTNLNHVILEAEQAIIKRFKTISLSKLSADVQSQIQKKTIDPDTNKTDGDIS